MTDGDKPQGTWPAVVRAAQAVKTDPFFVINGDTYCELNYAGMATRHALAARPPLITIAVDSARVNAGTMVMGREMVETIAGGASLEENISTAIHYRPDDVVFYPIKQRFYDLGTPERVFEFRRYWSMRSSKHRRLVRGQG